MTETAATGSALIATLERTWATIRQCQPELPDVVFITGTGLRHAMSASVDATWGHFGAERWVQGRPQPAAPPTTEARHGAKLDLQPNRKPELFVAGECFAEGAEHTLTTILHEAVHALAHVRQVQATSRQGKYHNRRFVELGAELGLAWPAGAKAHPVSGFSEVQMTEQARTTYADTITDLEAAITLHLDTFRRRRLGGTGQAGTGAEPTGDDGAAGGTGEKTFNRAKLVCACYPERSIRVSPKQAARGPILCGACGQEFLPETPPDRQDLYIAFPPAISHAENQRSICKPKRGREVGFGADLDCEHRAPLQARLAPAAVHLLQSGPGVLARKERI